MITLLITFCLFQSLQAQDNCKTRISDNHCVECNDGYYLKLVDNIETGIPSLVCELATTDTNCEANDGGACIRCKVRYYLQGNQCVRCGPGCNYCNSEYCYQCGNTLDDTTIDASLRNDTQLYLSTDEKTCIDCNIASNNEQCGRCQAGTYFNITLKSCQKCFTNCQLCTEEYNCYQCTNGKLLQKQGTPTIETPDKCIEIQHCTTEGLKEDHCELCETGYRLEAGNCVPCDNNCDVCYKNSEGKNYCSICSDGFVMNNGQCVEKGELHCKEGSTTYGCLECESHYFFDTTLVCRICDESCGNCVSESTHCLSCKEDFYFENGTTNCIKKDPHCNLVDQAGCKECINDLSTAEGQNTTGYFVPPNSQTCQPCTNHCKLCEGKDYHCSACTSDYVLNKTTEKAEDGVTDVEYYECTPMGETCVKTEMGYCTECKNGFFIRGGDSQECIQCDKSCGTCKVSTSCLSCNSEYYLSKAEQSQENVEHICRPQTEINMTCDAGVNGCETCKDGYYINRDDPSQYNCTVCPEECSTCTFKQTDSNDLTVGYPVCTGCRTEQEYVNDGKCKACSELKNCAACSGEKCVTCVEGYNIDAGGISCSKTNWALIIPLVVVGVIIIVLIFIAIIAIIWWRRAKSVKAETAAIKPFHVGSDLELLLLGADNEKFPLKTDKWELTFGLQKAKAVVDTEYTETINLANMSKSQYYFEFHYTPSHKYDLEIEPKSATLKPSTAIPVTFKIKMLCTTSVSDNIGISAMDIDDQN
ncbi:tyrosine kinase, putative, partial [Entamoeba invadens IP1]